MTKNIKVKTKKLKIAYVLDDTLDRNAGAQVYVLTLGDEMERLGHDVHYIVGDTPKKVRKNQYSLAKNIKVKFSGNHMSVPLFASKKEARLLLENERFDVVHVQTPFSPIMAGKVIKSAHGHSKIIATFHILPYGFVSRFSNRIFGYWLRLYNQYFDHYTCITEPSREFSKDYYGRAGLIIKYPVNISKIKNSIKKKLNKKSEIDLLFHGRLVERKGCNDLLKALNYAKENDLLKKDWFLHISGDGPDRAKIEKYINAHGLSNHVKLYGRTTDRKKFQLMNMSDITVYPAKSGESFGVVLVEAMASKGSIVLAGNNPGYSSVMDKASECLFDPKNTIEFAEHLAKYINNQAKRDALFKKQQKLVASYDVKKIAKEYIKLYKN